MNMSLKVKRVSQNAVLPIAIGNGHGYDLTAIDVGFRGDFHIFDTGLQIQPPAGYAAEIVPHVAVLAEAGYEDASSGGSGGVVDPEYRGNLLVILRKTRADAPDLELPCRIARLIARKIEDFPGGVEETNVLTGGAGGGGSSGLPVSRKLII
jgi:dUTPase